MILSVLTVFNFCLVPQEEMDSLSLVCLPLTLSQASYIHFLPLSGLG